MWIVYYIDSREFNVCEWDYASEPGRGSHSGPFTIQGIQADHPLSNDDGFFCNPEIASR